MSASLLYEQNRDVQNLIGISVSLQPTEFRCSVSNEVDLLYRKRRRNASVLRRFGTISVFIGSIRSADVLNCNIPANICPSTALRYDENYYSITWGSSCTSDDQTRCTGSDACLDYYGNQSSYADHCTTDDTYCYCGEHVVTACNHTCLYRYTVSKAGISDEKYYYKPSNLSQSYHDATVSFICKADSCNSGVGETTASASVIVGKTDGTDSTDGCSQGTNSSVACAAAKDYNTNTSWTCKGDTWGVGADESTTEKPYCCSTGIVCAAGQEGVKGGSRVEVKDTCTSLSFTSCASDKYCKGDKCVECLSNTDCSGGQVCQNNACVDRPCSSQSHCSGARHCTACGNNGQKYYQCTGTGTCESCTWGSWACHSRLQKPYRACSANGVAEKYETKDCPSGQSCSGGQCI